MELLKSPRRHLAKVGSLIIGGLALFAQCNAATWQYYVPFDAGKVGESGLQKIGKAFLWMPPGVKTIRGVVVGGKLGIELEIALDTEVRKACTENDLAIVYFSPHLSGTFHFWEEGNTDAQRWLKAFDDLAMRTGHAELKRVPWITMGHSTAGIFCRNVAYWKPERVAGVIHSKSGNFHQKNHLPPTGSLAGVPLVAINGHFETFGPEAGIQPELGRETQWIYVRKDIMELKAKDPNHLMSMWVDMGGDHFMGSLEQSKYAALFIRKTAKYRLPAQLPPGDEPVRCLPLKAEDGWLTDPELDDPKNPPAAFADYAGDKAKALWHYDREIADANVAQHRNMKNHQCLDNPKCTFLDEGDGWTFKAHSTWLDAMPEKFGGRVGNMKVGHSEKAFIYRAKTTEPVAQIGPDTFRLLRPVKNANVVAVHAGDEQFRPTHRWGSIDFPVIKGPAQSIDFPAIPDFSPKADGFDLNAKASSGLPVYYEVDYGPVEVKNNRLTISELPTNAKLPIECSVTAYQIGRRSGEPIPPAPPVTKRFSISVP